MRRHYRARRDAMIAALGRHLPEAEVRGVAAGLHVLVGLPSGVDDSALAWAARRRGVDVHPLSWHRTVAEPDRPGLVLGYASMSEARIDRGIRELAVALESL